MTAWLPNEDHIIINMVQIIGPKWSEIIQHLPGRTVRERAYPLSRERASSDMLVRHALVTCRPTRYASAGSASRRGSGRARTGKSAGGMRES